MYTCRPAYGVGEFLDGPLVLDLARTADDALGDRLDVKRRTKGGINDIESLLASALRTCFDHLGIIIDLMDVQVTLLGPEPKYAVVDQEPDNAAHVGLRGPAMTKLFDASSRRYRCNVGFPTPLP